MSRDGFQPIPSAAPGGAGAPQLSPCRPGLSVWVPCNPLKNQPEVDSSSREGLAPMLLISH